MHRKMFANPSFLAAIVVSLLATFCLSPSGANVIKDLSAPAAATSSPSLLPTSSSSSASSADPEAATLSQHGVKHEVKSVTTSHGTVAPLAVTSGSSHLSTTLLPNHHDSSVTVHHEAASSSAAATASSAASAVLEGYKAMTTMLPNVATSDHSAAKLHHNMSALSSSSATSVANLSLHKPLLTTMAPGESHLAVLESIAKVSSSLASNATLADTTMTPTATHHDLGTAKTSAAAMASSSLSNSSIKNITSQSGLVHHQQVSSTSSAASNLSEFASNKAEAKAPLSKFCDYMKPICASLDKILPKQLFKIQSQLKQFVQMSNGKLSMCFLEHYELDPNLKEVSKDDLNRLCQSKNIPAGKKGSLKDFESCAVKNWDPAIDKEIDRINAARLNCIKNHNHTSTKSGTTVAKITTSVSESHANLENEEDEVSLINEVVSKVLDDEKGTLSKNTDINVIDMSNHTNSSSSSSATSSSLSGLSASSSSISSAKGILNDPNTVVVFVDEGSGTKSTTKAPIATVDKQISSLSIKDTILPYHSTIKPMGMTEMKETKVMSKSQAESEASSSIKSTVSSMTTTQKPLASLVTKKIEITKKVENKLMGTTVAPVAVKVGEIEKKGTGKTTPALVNIKPTTLKPLETLEEMLKRQEKEKIEFENRLRLEREKVFRQMQRKQDELDAQNAIKALQVQRQATSSATASAFAKDSHDSDEHMHKLEHERQMAIDPIGHTIKHQQYELNKQQRMFG